MEFLHSDKDTFFQAINIVNRKTGVASEIIEKDYYITMILKALSKKLDYIVFKGGTSLSKCYRVINRFSEDIDIAIDKNLSQGQKRNIKKLLAETACMLGLKIPNLDQTRSRRDYNHYILEYESTIPYSHDFPVKPAVILETSYTAISFPTVVMSVHNYIGDMMEVEAPGYIEQYGLEPFEMKIQRIDRTFVDKVFALCDYYLQGRISQHSRHIYDVYKLFPYIQKNESLKKLIFDVRQVRKMSSICPSAVDGLDVAKLLKEIVEKGVYKSDYKEITEKLLEEEISYETAIKSLEEVSEFF